MRRSSGPAPSCSSPSTGAPSRTPASSRRVGPSPRPPTSRSSADAVGTEPVAEGRGEALEPELPLALAGAGAREENLYLAGERLAVRAASPATRKQYASIYRTFGDWLRAELDRPPVTSASAWVGNRQAVWMSAACRPFGVRHGSPRGARQAGQRRSSQKRALWMNSLAGRRLALECAGDDRRRGVVYRGRPRAQPARQHPPISAAALTSRSPAAPRRRARSAPDPR